MAWSVFKRSMHIQEAICDRSIAVFISKEPTSRTLRSIRLCYESIFKKFNQKSIRSGLTVFDSHRTKYISETTAWDVCSRSNWQLRDFSPYNIAVQYKYGTSTSTSTDTSNSRQYPYIYSTGTVWMYEGLSTYSVLGMYSSTSTAPVLSNVWVPSIMKTADDAQYKWTIVYPLWYLYRTSTVYTGAYTGSALVYSYCSYQRTTISL